jgi:hypothetical protein
VLIFGNICGYIGTLSKSTECTSCATKFYDSICSEYLVFCFNHIDCAVGPLVRAGTVTGPRFSSAGLCFTRLFARIGVRRLSLSVVPWSRLLHDNPAVAQLVTKIYAIYPWSINMFIRISHSIINLSQLSPFHAFITCLVSKVILFCHLHQGFASGFFTLCVLSRML